MERTTVEIEGVDKGCEKGDMGGIREEEMI